MAYFALLPSPKLISRKIWVIEKYWNFDTVYRLTYNWLCLLLIGNVWRFPYLAQKNGGGAFLIPYFIMLLVEGLPIFLLELALGQRLRKGAIGAWQRISPWLGGVGIASGVVSLTVGLYYNTVIAWCLYYFGKVSLDFTWKKFFYIFFSFYSGMFCCRS